MMILFQRESCPYCKVVRQLLTDLGVSYVAMNQPKPRDERTLLIKATGGPYIPALIDGDTVISGRLEDPSHLVEYINAKFSKP